MINKRILSTLLALAILLSCVGWTPVQAQGTAPEEETIDNVTQIMDNEDSPEYVDAEQFEESGHVQRLHEEEELDTYVYLNEDGSKSVYYMDQDVKFIDEQGNVRDKDTALVRKERGYGMRSNDVGLHIPDNAADGIAVSHKSREVKLLPVGGTGLAAANNNSILYSNFFGRGIHLQYTPMLSGVKEDVIITKYTGVNSFSFLLETGGLYLFDADGRYYLAESATAKAAFYLGEVLVYDAIGRPDLGTMAVETITPGQRYKLTISANEAFLTDPETLYPVTVDPTLTVSDNTHGTGAIEDAPVFSGKPNKNFGSYVYNTIGYHSADYGTAMTVVRLSGLLADDIYGSLSESNIENVTFYMKDGGSSSAAVNIHALSGNSTWTESNVTWNNRGIYSVAICATDTMGSGSWGEFDITNLVKSWKNGTNDPQCGFAMVVGDSTKKIGALSSEYSNTDYRPYVVITHTLDTVASTGFSDAYTVTSGSTVFVNIDSANEEQYLKFVPAQTDFYTIRSSQNNCDPYIRLYNNNYTQIAYHDNGIDNNFNLTFHFVQGQTYYLKTRCSGSTTGHYLLQILPATDPSAITVASISLDNDYSVSSIVSLSSSYFSFTPAVTGEYLFYSFNQSGDPEGWLYDSALSSVSTSSNLGVNTNFRISANLTAGKTYYLAAGSYPGETGTYHFSIMMAPSALDDVFYVRNLGSSYYINYHTRNDVNWVFQYSYSKGAQSRWNIERQADGYYTIQCTLNNQYLSATSTAIGSGIKLNSSVSDLSRWKIYVKSSGEMFLELKNAPGRVLSAPDQEEESELVLKWMTADLSGANMWKFEVQSPITIEHQAETEWCWVASARMLMRHCFYNISTDFPSQASAVENIKHTENISGTLDESLRAANYFQQGKSNPVNLISYADKRYSEIVLVQLINDGHAVWIGRNPAPDTGETMGHAVLIAGYSIKFNQGTACNYFIIYDPEPAQQYIWSYPRLCDGRNPVAGEDGDTSIWEWIISVEGYSTVPIE